MVIHREIGLADLWRIIVGAVTVIAQIMMIVTAAGVYASLLTTSGIPHKIVAEINTLHLPIWATLLSINVVLLVMGSFLEPPAAILILRSFASPASSSTAQTFASGNSRQLTSMRYRNWIPLLHATSMQLLK